MHAARLFIAFLLSMTIGLTATSITGNQSSYNPGDYVYLTLTNDNNSANGDVAYVNISNVSHTFRCATPTYTSYIALANCTLPTNLANGTWGINVTSAYNLLDNASAIFGLNATNMTINISQASYLPADTLVYYANMTFLNTSQFSINTSNFNISANATGIVHGCSALTMVSAGYYNGTCSINTSAIPGDYLLSAAYPSSNASGAFAVNVSYSTPNIALNVTSFTMDKGNSTYINVTIRSNSNMNDNITVSLSGCDGENLTCSIYSQLAGNQTTVSAFGITNVTVNITAPLGSNFSAYTVTINASRWNDTSKSNQTAVSATINPFHNFSLATSASPGSAVPGSAATYTFYLNNTGENATRYNFSCVSNISAYTCAFNATNGSVLVSPNALMYVNISVTVPMSAYSGETAKTNVTVLDYFGLSQLIEGGGYFKTSASESMGNVTVTNISQYPHNAGEEFYFNITINNTGNIDSETSYNITIVGQNLTGWVLNISNTTDFLNSVFNDTGTSYNFTMTIGNLASKNISVKVTVPAAATHHNYTKLWVYAVSANNTARHSENASVIIKLPNFTFSVNMNYNSTMENLTWTIANITRESGVNLVSFSFLNYTIKQANGTLQRLNLTANISQLYFNSTRNIGNDLAVNGTWPSGNYTLNITGGTVDGYNFSFEGQFYLARWVAVSASASSISGVVSGSTITLTIANTFESSGISVNTTNTDWPVTAYFYGTTGALLGSGGSCTYVLGTTYQYTCVASATEFNATYYLNVSSEVTKCSRYFNCTFGPSRTNRTYVQIGELTSAVIGATTPVGSASSGSNTTTAPNTTTIVSTSTGLIFTMPAAITTLSGAQTITLALNNSNLSEQDITIAVGEAGDYIHFSTTYIAPQHMLGHAVSTINITMTPFKWAKPGTYTVSVTINSATGTFSVTVPQPTDSDRLHRYVEVSKDRTKSKVYLYVKNMNSFSIIANVTEDLPKALANSASAMTIDAGSKYQILQEDPVIMWTLELSPNQEKSVSYSLSGDVSNSNLFTEPTVTEIRASAAASAAAGDITIWLILAVIMVAIVAGIIVYFLMLRPKGVKLPAQYAAFQQDVKKKGIIETIIGMPANTIALLRGAPKKSEAPAAPVIKIVKPREEAIADKVKAIFSRLIPKKKKLQEKSTQAKTPEQNPKEPLKLKPTKEELLKKLNDVYKKEP